MRKLIPIFIVACATLSATETLEQPAVQQKPVQAEQTEVIQLDGRNWRLGHEMKEEGRLTKEFVLDGEETTSWTELFSIQQFNDVPVAPQEFFKLFVEGLKQAVPQNKVESKIIQESENTLLGEWWIQDKTPNDQHEWIKIFKEGDEILILRYTTKKTQDVESIRKKWEDILTNFKANRETSP